MKTAFQRTAAVALAMAGMGLATHAAADITLYEHEGFEGRSLNVERSAESLRANRFNDRASSAIVNGRRWERWEVCDGAGFSGRCVVLRPGQYPSLGSLGLNDSISSARQIDRRQRVDDDRYGPAPVVDRDFRRRPGERLYTADVVNVRAVVSTPEQQRCWTERNERTEGTDNRVPGAIAGAVIGGILGHQVGGGSGRDLATIGGVIGGAAIGSQIGGRGELQEVQRCRQVPAQSRTDFYDVTYRFRGQEHHVQMTQKPGSTILVNREGEPRA